MGERKALSFEEPFGKNRRYDKKSNDFRMRRCSILGTISHNIMYLYEMLVAGTKELV